METKCLHSHLTSGCDHLTRRVSAPVTLHKQRPLSSLQGNHTARESLLSRTSKRLVHCSAAGSSPPTSQPTANPQPPQSTADTAAAKALTKQITAAQSVEELLELILAKNQRFTYIHAGVAFHRIAKHGKRLPEVRKEAIRRHQAVALCVDILLKHAESWDATTVSNLLYAHAVMRHGTRPLLAKILVQLRKEREYDPCHVISLVYGMTKLNCRHPVFFRRLDTLIKSPAAATFSSTRPLAGGDNSNNGNEQVTINGTNRKPTYPDAGQRMSSVLECTPSFETCDTRDLTLLAWSVTQLYKPETQLPTPATIQASFDLAISNIRKTQQQRGSIGVSFQSLFMLVSSAANCPAVKFPVLNVVMDVVCTAIATQPAAANRMSPRDCSSLIHAFAKLATKTVQESAKNGVNKSGVAPHNPMWRKQIMALFKQHPNGGNAVQVLVDALQQSIPQMTEQELTISAWGCAMLQIKRIALSSALESRAVELASQMTPQGLSQMCWAFAVLHVDSELLMESMAGAAADILSNPESKEAVTSQALAMLAYSLALLDRCSGPQAVRLLHLIAQHAEETMSDFSPQGRCNLAWGFAVAGYYPPGFFQRWRNAVANASNRRAPSDLISPLDSSSSSSSSSEELGTSGSGSRSAAMPAALQPELRFTPQELAQLHQVEVALRLEAPEIGMGTPADYVNFFDALYKIGRSRASAKAGWGSMQTDKPRSISRYQHQVHASVCDLGIPCSLEHYDDAIEYSIDVAIPSHKIAVEADGPTHFAVNTNRPLGATSLKRRILEKLGWKVVDVPYFEWAKWKAEGQHGEYIREKLAAAGVLFEPIGGADIGQWFDYYGEGGVVKDIDSLSTAAGTNGKESLQMVSTSGNGKQEQQLSIMPADEKEVQEIRERAQQLDLLKFRSGSLSKAGLLAKAAGRKAAAAAAGQSSTACTSGGLSEGETSGSENTSGLDSGLDTNVESDA